MTGGLARVSGALPVRPLQAHPPAHGPPGRSAVLQECRRPAFPAGCPQPPPRPPPPPWRQRCPGCPLRPCRGQLGQRPGRPAHHGGCRHV
eukprot:12223919-Alexandrium_andersonii.AAC.1